MGMGWLLNRGGGRVREPDPTRTARNRGVALIGGSEPKTAKLWADLVEPVAEMFVRRRWTLVYCGMGTGLSGAIATRVLSRSGKAKAVLMRGLEPPDVPAGVTKVLVADYHARQKKLLEGTTSILVLPGGLGTLAELSTAAVLGAAGLIEKPVLLDPSGWFGEVAGWYDKAVAAGASRVALRDSVNAVTEIAQVEKIIQESMDG